MTPGPAARRAAALTAFAVAVAALAYVLLGSHHDYVIHARFESAGRVVKGAAVEVGGREVGTVTDVGLSADGQADLALRIDDPALRPLHVGARAAIRQVGIATLANNFVELAPGSRSAPPLAGGSVLSTVHTTGIVDMDAVLDSLDRRARLDVSGLIAHSADVFAGSGSRWFNGMLQQLAPALTEIDAVATQLAADQTQLDGFIRGAARASATIASRRQDLRTAVRNTAVTMRAVSSRRLALQDLLQRAPAVLQQATGTLAHLGQASGQLRPALRDVPAAARPLGPFLRDLTTVMDRSRPVLGTLDQQLPRLAQALERLAPLAAVAVPALRSATTAFTASRHVARGVRYYASDLLVGILNGLVSISGGTYDKAGHYIHLEFAQSPQQFLAGPFAKLLSQPLIPGVFGMRTGLVSRCPGAVAPPAPDGSSPYVPDPSICDPADSMSAAVNQP